MATSEVITENQKHMKAPEIAADTLDIGIETSADLATELLSQVDRILGSEELRGCEVLHRLLKFLAMKSVSGEADELKEYTVAIEGLGKPPSYDPRHKSAVRIQVGRLRQKLANYYRTEGLQDSLVIDVPKGRFKLTCDFREYPESLPLQSSAPHLIQSASFENGRKKTFGDVLLGMLRPAAWIAAGVLMTVAAWTALHWLKPAQANATSISYMPSWSPETAELWRPFVATSRTMIVVIEDPLFVELDVKKGVYYRDRTLDSWNEIVSSPTVGAIREAMKSHDIEPSRYYTAFGEVDSSFLIASLLGSRVQHLSVVRTTDLSTRELADNNVVFVGNENKFFTQGMQDAPIASPLQPVPEGIRNMNPKPNEPKLFVDHFSTAPFEEGVVYALVTHIPGPLGGNDVESFTSSRAPGYVAAVKEFTELEFVRPLVAKLKQSCGGKIPRYYQVLFKVKFKDEVPTEITYVLARELHFPNKQ